MNRHLRSFARATALLAIAGNAGAVTRVWPSFSGIGCTGTLQACINASGTGDVVVIGADDVLFPDAYTAVDESLVIDRAITLRAADGIDAVFAPGRVINVLSPATGPFDITLAGLQLRGGHILFEHATDGAARYTLDRVRLRNGDAESCAVNLRGTGTGRPQLVVGDSHFRFDTPRTSTNFAICTFRDGGTWQVDLFRNRILATAGALFGGISVTGTSAGPVTIDANRIDGRDVVRGIDVSQNDGSAANTLRVQNNVVSGQSTAAAVEYAIQLRLAATDAHVVNNTVAWNRKGLRVAPNGGGNTGRVANNLVAHDTDIGLVIDPALTAVANADNLVFHNGLDAFTPGPGTVTADPQLRNRYDPRPSAGSPAINAGSNADVPPSLFNPFDADGELRVVGGTVDIGAYEANDDLTVVQQATPANTSLNTTAISSLAGRLGNDEALQITPLASHATAAEAASNLGVFLNGGAPGSWEIFSENIIALSAGRRYAVMAPLNARQRFVHATTLANIVNAYTTLDSAELNGRPFALAFVTHNWNPGGVGGTYHDHRTGLSYAGSRWSVGNQDPVDMTAGRAFNIAVAPVASPNAFKVDVGTTSRATVPLAHRLLDDNPCAAVFVTRNNGTGGATSDVAYALRYRRGANGAAGSWAIETVGAGTGGFAANTAFNVMVQGAQANACLDDLIFADGFDGD